MPVAHIEAPPQCFTVAEDGTTEEEVATCVRNLAKEKHNQKAALLLGGTFCAQL
jgi:hypothetical protein